MNEAKIKACPFCGKPPTIKQAGRTNYWWVGCVIHLGPESSGCGVSHSDYIREEAIRKWNERAGDREPVMSKTPEPSTLASATGYDAHVWLIQYANEDGISHLHQTIFEHEVRAMAKSALEHNAVSLTILRSQNPVRHNATS